MRNDDAPPRARIQAADILLDRGWGKPAPTPQRHTGEDDKDIRITSAISIDVGVRHSTGRWWIPRR
jgi:hypothetical protein